MQTLAFILNTTDDIMGADYKGAVNSVLDFIESAWQILAAAAALAADIVGMVWHNGGADAAINIRQWWDDEFIPGVENAITAVYSAGVRCRILWERLNSPLFISL